MYHQLSPLSKLRFDRGAYLRVLDSKEAQDKIIMISAPKFSDYLSSSSRERFDSLLKKLNLLSISFIWDEQLVRGLDYYSHTCFEFVSSNDGLTVLAGGRYDGLAEAFGHSSLPSIGWAAGLERIKLFAEECNIAWPRAKCNSVALVLKRDEKISQIDAKQELFALRMLSHFVHRGYAIVSLATIQTLRQSTAFQVKVYSWIVIHFMQSAVQNNAGFIIFVNPDDIQFQEVAEEMPSDLSDSDFSPSIIMGVEKVDLKNLATKSQINGLRWSQVKDLIHND